MIEGALNQAPADKIFSITDRLNQNTQTKVPSDTDPLKQTESDDFWGDKEPEIKPNTPGQQQQQQSVTDTPDEPAKMTREKAMANAGVSVEAINQITITAGTWKINSKFKNKITEEQIEKLTVLEDIPKEKISKEEDKMLLSKWERLMDKRDKKLGRLPMKEQNKSNMKEAFAAYHQATGKAMAPELLLVLAIVTHASEKGTEIFSD